MCRQRTRPSLGGEAGGRSLGFISRPHVFEKASPLPRLRCQLNLAHGVLDVAVAHLGLERSGVVAGVGELSRRRGAAAGVAQHVDVDRKGHLHRAHFR